MLLSKCSVICEYLFHVFLPIKFGRTHAFIVPTIYQAQCLVHTCLVSFYWMNVANRLEPLFNLPSTEKLCSDTLKLSTHKKQCFGAWILKHFFLLLKRIWFLRKTGKRPYNFFLSWFLVQFSAYYSYTWIQIPCAELLIILPACSLSPPSQSQVTNSNITLFLSRNTNLINNGHRVHHWAVMS